MLSFIRLLQDAVITRSLSTDAHFIEEQSLFYSVEIFIAVGAVHTPVGSSWSS